MIVTMNMRKISFFGILVMVLKLAHSNVPIATMIIKPVKAAMGTCSIKADPNTIKTNNITEATIPESLALAPEDTLIKLCPIMAQPPIPEKKPDVMLAIP